jgi:cytochrome c biogenesis protein
MGTYLIRLWRFLGSTELAVILLIAVILGALVGTLFPQLTPDTAADPVASARWLTTAQEKYAFLFGLYRGLGLFDVYHSPWFLALVAALLLSTVVCTVDRLRFLWRAVTARPRIEQTDVFYERMPNRISLAVASMERGEKALRRVLGRRRYHVVAERQGGVTYLFAERNRLARLATLVTHISLVLLVLGTLWSGWGGWRERAVALGPGQVYERPELCCPQRRPGDRTLPQRSAQRLPRSPGGIGKGRRSDAQDGARQRSARLPWR